MVTVMSSSSPESVLAEGKYRDGDLTRHSHSLLRGPLPSKVLACANEGRVVSTYTFNLIYADRKLTLYRPEEDWSKY